MRAGKFADLLEQFAAPILAAGGDAAAVTATAKALRLSGRDQLEVALASWTSAFDRGAAGGGPRLGDARKAIAAALPLFEEVAKIAFVRGLRIFLEATKGADAVSLVLLERKLSEISRPSAANPDFRENLVVSAARDLGEVIGDADRFDGVFERVEADRGVRRQEAVELACRVSGRIARSSPRKAAFDAIKAAHVRRLGASARRRYFDDKSAA